MIDVHFQSLRVGTIQYELKISSDVFTRYTPNNFQFFCNILEFLLQVLFKLG